MRLMELKGQPRIIVVYGGGFQPFHMGHMSSYSQAKAAFPDADFYVAASNDTKTRPIPFDAKKFLAQQAGVADDFVQVRQPINPQEIMQKYDATRDILVLVRSERDPMSYTKKDGSPGYYQPFVSVEDCVPFDQHGYIFVTKKHTFKVNGQEIYSGSQVREMYAAADEGEQESIVAQLYPDSNQLDKIKQIFDQYLSQQGVAEGLNEFAMSGGDDSNDLQLYFNVAKKLNMKKYKPSTAHNLIAKKMAELVDVVDDDKVDYARHMARKEQGLPNMLEQGVAEANINQQVSLWHPETQTYRGAGNKIPTSDYAGDNDITKNRRRVNKFKHSEILPNLNFNVSLGGNDDSIEKVEQNITREKIKKLIHDQFHLLNSREKEILYHKFWHDMKPADIAQQMSLSIEIVKRTADSALKKLRKSPDVRKLIPYLDSMTEGLLDEFAPGPDGFGPFKIYIEEYYTGSSFATFDEAWDEVAFLRASDPKSATHNWRILDGTGKTVWQYDIGDDIDNMRRGHKIQFIKPDDLKEFTTTGSNDREPDEEEILRKLAARWWLGTEQQMAQAQRALATMGWEIGQDESGDEDAGVFVIRAGDVNGNSYIAFNHSDLELNESQGDSLKSNALSALMTVKQKIQQDRMAELEKWEQDFKNNVVSKFKSRWPDAKQPSTSTPVAQPGEKHSELKAKLSQLNMAIEKQAMLDKLVQKLDSKGLLSPTIQAGVDTSLLVRDGARDNYVSLNQKLDKALDFVNNRLMTHKAAYAKPKTSMSENMDHSKDDQAVPELKSAMLDKKEKLQDATDDEVYDIIDTMMTRIAKSHGISGQKLHDMWVDKYEEIPDTWIMDENFADGRHPERKGLAKRSGVDTKAGVSDLRKTARNSSGEKARMAHWLANMKAGRAKKSK